MSRPPFEVADIIRISWRQLPRTVQRFVDLAAAQGARCDRALPYRCARWSSRCVRKLRTSGHLV